MAQSFMVQLARIGLMVGGGLVALAAAERWEAFQVPWTVVAGAAVMLVFLAATLLAFARRPELAEVAGALDQRGGTHDRWTTFLSFGGGSAGEMPLHALAQQECVAYLCARDFRPVLRWGLPREFPWLAVPALALALLLWDIQVTRLRLAEERAEGLEGVAETVDGLQALAEQAERASKDADSEELKRIAEALRKSAEAMKASAANRDEAEKSTMRQLSALEQMVKSLQQGPARATPEELKALAGALKEKPETEGAADAMQRGDLAKAAEELDALAAMLKEKGDALTEEQVEKAIQEALERLAEQRQLSEALQQLVQQMAETNGQQGATNETLQKLAQLLRQMQPQPGQQGPAGKGQQPTEEMLKNLLAALQNMKNGGGQQQGDPSQDSSGGSGKVAIQSFSGQPQPGEGDPMAGAQIPTGRPGTERDSGTTASATGTQASEPAEKGADLALRGQLGEGESLSQFTPAAADSSQARQRYRELYEAMAPAAQAAVLQEEIPLGSRFFIKRYFEAIRPPQ